MSSWVRRNFDGIGLTQSPPGRYLEVIQRQYGGTVLLCIDVSNSMSGEPLRQAIRGGEKFLNETADAHYQSGLILWNHTVASYVEPDAPLKKVLSTLRHARSSGLGTDLVPTLRAAKKLFARLDGDRVLCVFGDGDGCGRKAVSLARDLCAMGVRIVVRGLGRGATAALSRLLCPGAAKENSRVIKDVKSIESGIAGMSDELTGMRRSE